MQPYVNIKGDIRNSNKHKLFNKIGGDVLAKKTFKELITVAKKIGPTILKEAPTVISTFSKVKQQINQRSEKSEGKKRSIGKIHYRKIRYSEFYSAIIPNLDNYSYIELRSFIEEIKNYIVQLENEKNKHSLNQTIISRRIKKWDDLLVQLKDKLATKCYLEFLKIHNTFEYRSTFFEEKIVSDFKNISAKEEQYNFIKRYTNKTENEFNDDFY